MTELGHVHNIPRVGYLLIWNSVDFAALGANRQHLSQYNNGECIIIGIDITCMHHIPRLYELMKSPTFLFGNK